jgi:hypothetical protein
VSQAGASWSSLRTERVGEREHQGRSKQQAASSKQQQRQGQIQSQTQTQKRTQKQKQKQKQKQNRNININRKGEQDAHRGGLLQAHRTVGSGGAPPLTSDQARPCLKIASSCSTKGVCWRWVTHAARSSAARGLPPGPDDVLLPPPAPAAGLAAIVSRGGKLD